MEGRVRRVRVNKDKEWLWRGWRFKEGRVKEGTEV